MSSITTRSDNQVLEFELEDECYCVAIDHINEIINYSDSITSLPNAPPHVLGVMDLRGKTTTVISPKKVLNIHDETDANRIIIFDSDNGSTIGWVVDEVRQVVGIDDERVDDSMGSEYLYGVIRQDDELVLWINPDTVRAN